MKLYNSGNYCTTVPLTINSQKPTKKWNTSALIEDTDKLINTLHLKNEKEEAFWPLLIKPTMRLC